MPIALILVNTEIGSEGDAPKSLTGIEGKEEACSVYGVYDIIVEIKAELMAKLKDMVTWRIPRVNKVRSTLTIIVLEQMTSDN